MKKICVGLLLLCILCIPTLGCDKGEQMMLGMGGSGTEEPTVTEEPPVTEEPTVLEPPPGVERLEGCDIPRGYIPVNVAPDNSIVLAPVDRETGREDPSSDKPRLAMHPSCELFIIYPRAAGMDGYDDWPEDETLELGLSEVALRFNLPTCGDIPPRGHTGGCIDLSEPEPEPEVERPLW